MPQQRFHAQSHRRVQRRQGQSEPVSTTRAGKATSGEQGGGEGEARQDQGGAEGLGSLDGHG